MHILCSANPHLFYPSTNRAQRSRPTQAYLDDATLRATDAYPWHLAVSTCACKAHRSSVLGITASAAVCRSLASQTAWMMS